MSLAWQFSLTIQIVNWGGGGSAQTTPLFQNVIVFTHGPRRWNHGSTDGLFLLLLLLLLLLNTTKCLFLLGTENANFQTGLTFQATPVTPISSCSSFYFLEYFCLENCPLLSGELSTDSRQSSDSYCSSVQSSPGLDI